MQSVDDTKAVYVAWKLGAVIQSRWTDVNTDGYFEGFENWEDHDDYPDYEDAPTSAYIYMIVHDAYEDISCMTRSAQMEYRIKPKEEV